MAKHYAGVTILDASDESSSTSFSIGAVTAISIAGFLTQFGAWKTALGNIILGKISKDIWVGDRTDIDNVPPTDSNAQIELKWLLSYQANTTKKTFREEIACPDTAKLIPGTDQADMTDTDIAAFVDAVEDLYRSPDDDAESVTVLSMKLVGRNN